MKNENMASEHVQELLKNSSPKTSFPEILKTIGDIFVYLSSNSSPNHACKTDFN
jgi:hypothetical protein